jgi:hypothetical protein
MTTRTTTNATHTCDTCGRTWKGDKPDTHSIVGQPPCPGRIITVATTFTQIGSSPLEHAIDGVIRAYETHLRHGRQIGANRDTRRIVGAAEELTILTVAIRAGSRDRYGYPVEAGPA